MKGVVLAGGLGSRLYPLTKGTNKHLLPVYNRPMIHWPIMTLVEARIRELLVVAGGHYSGMFMQTLGAGREFGLKKLQFVYQEGEGGIAHALSHAESFVGVEPFVVILGDNIYEQSLRKEIDSFRRAGSGARILLKETAEAQEYSVAQFDSDEKLVNIKEKPDKPASNFVVTGVYMFDAQVWDILPTLDPGNRGVVEIVDVLNAYRKKEQLEHGFVDGWWTNAGSFDALQRATNLVAERENNEPFASFLDKISTKNFT